MLLVGTGSGEDVGGGRQLVELFVGRRVEVVAAGDEITLPTLVGKFEALGDGMCGGGMIAGDHDHAQPRGPAFFECVADAFADRIVERDQPRVAQHGFIGGPIL